MNQLKRYHSYLWKVIRDTKAPALVAVFSLFAGYSLLVGVAVVTFLPSFKDYDGLTLNLFWSIPLGWFAWNASFIIWIYILSLGRFLVSSKVKRTVYSPIRLSVDKDFLNDSGPKTWAKFYRSFLGLPILAIPVLLYHFDLYPKTSTAIEMRKIVHPVIGIVLGWWCYWRWIWWRDLVARDKLKSQKFSDFREKIRDEGSYNLTNIFRRYNSDLKKYYNRIKWEYLFITYLILSIAFTAVGAFILEMEYRGELPYNVGTLGTIMAIAIVASPAVYIVLGYFLLLAFYTSKKDRVFFKGQV